MPTNNDNTTGYIVGGIVAILVLKMVRDLFGGVGSALGINTEASREKDRIKAATLARSKDFSDPDKYPELWRGTPLLDLALAGKVTPSELDAIKKHAPAVVQAAKDYHNAKGVVVDSEDRAVSAVASMPSYLVLLWLADTFSASYGTTLGAYGVTFLEPADKATICNIIDRLRQ